MPETMNCVVTIGESLGISMQHVKIGKWYFVPLLKQDAIWGKKHVIELFWFT